MTEPGFKLTELGPLPEEWKVVRLRDLVNEGVLWMKNGFPQGKHNQNGDGVLHLRPFNITESGEIDTSQKKFVTPPPQGSRYWVLPGDVIFNNTNSEELIGKTAYFYLSGHFVLSNHMTLIRVMRTEIVEAYYLAKYLHQLWYRGLFRQMCRRHVNQASVSLERLKQIFIPLPPLPEQRAIARTLSTIQRAREAAERVIAAARDLKRSLMRKLFTEGLDAKAPRKMTEIGEIPAHWEVAKLEDVTERARQTDPRKNPTWRFKYVDVSGISNERLRIENYTEYEGKDAPHRARKPIKNGDVIFATVRPSLKRVAIVPTDFDGQICSTAFCVIRCRPEVAESKFVFQVVSTDGFVDRVSENERGSSYPAVTDKDVLNQIIPLPPLPEQRAIARILSTLDRKIEAEERRLAALRDLFRTLLRELMTGHIRVWRPYRPPPLEQVLPEMVRRIVEVARPEKIILFGSAARGEMGPDSDVDLLVVVKGPVHRGRLAEEIYMKMGGVGIAKDIIVVTAEDVERYKDSPALVVYPALREGKVVYAA